MMEDFLDRRSKSMSVCWKEDDQSLFLIGSQVRTMISIRPISGPVGLGVKNASSRSKWSSTDFAQNKLVSMGVLSEQ
jgi:hypothetical protein